MEASKNHFFTDISVILGRSMHPIFRSMDTIIMVTIMADRHDAAVRL